MKNGKSDDNQAFARLAHRQEPGAHGRAHQLLFSCGSLSSAVVFSQPSFAHHVTYKRFTVHARAPIGNEIIAVLDRAESRLAASPINDAAIKPRIFLTNSTSLYASFSLYIGAGSFGKGYAALPTANIVINAHDPAQDLVFRDAPVHNVRSLSGVIAHETTHLLIRNRVGYWRNLTMPDWKKEGYAEYVAGGSTLSHETGVKLWKARPDDPTGYRYFKYFMMVKYLLEHEKRSVDELFTHDFDVEALAATVLQKL
jgi:hypothetical protein